MHASSQAGLHTLCTVLICLALQGCTSTQQPVASATSIGAATLLEGNIIRLQLRATSDTGAMGDAILFIHPDNPQHEKTLRHLQGLKPGETKQVPPWP